MPLGAKDAPACLLPSGNVLCTVAPVDGSRDNYLTPTSFFEFDGTSLMRVPDPPNSGGAPFSGVLLVIPSGQALYSAQSPEIYAYTLTQSRTRTGDRRSPSVRRPCRREHRSR